MADNGRRRSRREQWVLDVLDRSGTARGVEDGVYSYTLEGRLAELLEREELEFTFQRRRAGRAGIELAAAGSWLHDQLLRYAAEWGRVAILHAPAGGDLHETGLKRRRWKGTPGEVRERRYVPVYRFTFRVAFYGEPPGVELVEVVWDTGTGRRLARGIPARVEATLVEEADPDILAPAHSDPPEAFRRAWEAVEHEVETRVRELQEEGQEKLDREVASLERYYRQLIDEEKRLLKTRTGKQAREEAERKLDLLKLEWERRVKEETERFRPQVMVRLVAAATLLFPAELRDLAGGGGNEPEAVWIDPLRGECWPAAAPADVAK
jgi:hypothetical protein